MLDRKSPSVKTLIRLVWLFCRRSAEQQRQLMLILEAFDQSDQR